MSLSWMAVIIACICTYLFLQHLDLLAIQTTIYVDHRHWALTGAAKDHEAMDRNERL
jgi:hypothetical protein